MENITKEVLKIPVQKVDGSEWLLINELYKHIYGSLKEVGNPDTRKFIHPQINFEDLLHILEMCLTYSSCWHDEYLQWSYFPQFGSLVEPKELMKSIDTIEYRRAAYLLENRVMEIVNQYDSAFKENSSTEGWYRGFWKSLSGKANIFNLNYDNTIENSLGEYEDGFPPIKDSEEYSRFSAKRYYENPRRVSTIAHLHGQILFSEAKEFPFEYSIRDMVKNRDYETACKNRIGGQQNPSNQAKEEY